jgi:alanyl-tRNA synthetase
MNTNSLRKAFLEFYEARGHTIVPGVSTIPTGDATILFTIAGMAPFKDILAGKVPPTSRRVANCQRCIRAADLEDVGLDGRHLTMFEMLGVWSFGDYSKKESIAWTWEFITDVLHLDTSKIWASVHTSDEESRDLWRSVGMAADQIVALGDADNFWAMGPTGPCGPCSELYYDQGPNVGCGASCKGPGCDCDRYLEFWNNVFMEFYRDDAGTLHHLPHKNVDTGVGLERLAAICQGKTSAYGSDSFQALWAEVCKELAIPDSGLSLEDEQSIQVISDHMRMLTVTLSDGAHFSNEGRGYVLRRILRRATRFAHRLRENHKKPTESPVLFRLPAHVASVMGSFYPELAREAERVSHMIREEEERFLLTLDKGLQHFRQLAEKLPTGAVFAGRDLFALHDTFGFPVDLTALLCREKGLIPDMAEFESQMEEQRERSRQSSRFYTSDALPAFSPVHPPAGAVGTLFTGYGLGYESAPADHHPQWLPSGSTQDYAVVREGQTNLVAFRIHPTPPASSETVLDLVFARSPFYAEGGGQVADSGFISFGDSLNFEVIGVTRSPEGAVHTVRITPSSSAFLSSESHSHRALEWWHHALLAPQIFYIQRQARLDTARNHTATHLLHAALRSVLGEHVRQAGSQVTPQGLRFDFSHPKALEATEIEAVENWVYNRILDAQKVETLADVPIDEARKMGALAMFDEKYGDRVRVIRVGNETTPASIELCGGTHVTNTAHICDFQILAEGSVTSGVRRIEAATGRGLRHLHRHRRHLLEHAAAGLRCSVADVPERIEALRENEKTLARRIEELEAKMAAQASRNLADQGVTIAPGLVLVTHHLGAIASSGELESFGDTLRDRTRGVVVLGALLEGKAQLLAIVHPDVRKTHPRVSAGGLIKELAAHINGRGGGKPEFARAGGTAIDGIPVALQNAEQCLRNQAELTSSNLDKRSST